MKSKTAILYNIYCLVKKSSGGGGEIDFLNQQITIFNNNHLKKVIFI